MNPVLRQFRKSLGLNQREFGAEVGIHPTYLCQIEVGTENLGHKNALRIAERYREELAAAGITLEELLRPHERAA